MGYDIQKLVNFGRSHRGLGTVGYRLLNPDGTIFAARTTVGVIEMGGATGQYATLLSMANDSWRGVILWDTGGSDPEFASAELNPVRDMWIIPLAAIDVPATVGGHVVDLNAGVFADAVWDEPRAGHTASGTFGEALQLETGYGGVLASATSTTAVLGTNEGTTANFVGWSLTIHKYTGVGQSRVITGYVPATRTATVDRPWTVTPDNTSEYKLWPPVALDPGGLDNVTIETGIHARRAFQVIAAATAGAETRPTATTVAYAAVNNSGTPRISATIDATTGRRSAVSFTL